MKKMIVMFLFLLSAVIIGGCAGSKGVNVKPEQTEMPAGQWQTDVTFPDWNGSLYGSYAVNNRLGFQAYEGQGEIFVSCENISGDFSI